MGKSSPASCFKIITCGSDSVDHDDLQTPESKGSSARGWSFRKRSARHRVLSNIAVSESSPTSAANKASTNSTNVTFQPQDNKESSNSNIVAFQPEVIKESPDSTAVTFQPEVIKESPDSTAVTSRPESDITVPDKNSTVQTTEEKNEVSKEFEPPISHDKVNENNECGEDAMLDESTVVVIQAGIRGSLAQKLLLKQKSIIKLQAVVRGHLVRKQAVGTLRCVQAIVKMQGLVRARRSRVVVEESGGLVKQGESHENHNQSFLGERRSTPLATPTYISIEKLLSNRFARQLMISSPSAQINIKCDPLKPDSDSAWKWLERWMAASSPSIEEQQSPEAAEFHDENEHFELSDDKNEILDSSNIHSESTVFIPGEVKSENDGYLLTNDENKLDLHSSKSVTPIDESYSAYDVQDLAPVKENETDFISDLEQKAPLNKEETASDRGTTESEVKKFSRKSSNPSFIAAQSKFEELTSAKLTTSSSRDDGVEPETCLENASTSDQPLSSKDVSLAENPVSNSSTVQIGGSECGTELSISSTLDSPDRSDLEVNQIGQEQKIPNVTDESPEREEVEVKQTSEEEPKIADLKDPSGAKEYHELERCETVNSVTGALERYESMNSATGETFSTLAVASTEFSEKLEADPSHQNLHGVSGATHSADQLLSPEGSPRSHITFPESLATPSSQVSVKTKKGKGDKSGSSNKKKSSSGERKSSATPNQDSGSRNSMEQKEHKTGKRRNSFGPTKPDADQEPRNSSSGVSLPSYMQATESARAKAIALANASPRSSPDVHDKDLTLKKRHSLPGSDGRQGSPRIQRSLSQAPQNTKGNGAHSPQDRKWRR